MMTITHRERFKAVASHKAADRVVFDLCGCPQTLIDAPSVKERLAGLLGIWGDEREERVLSALGIDTRLVGGMPTPGTSHVRWEGDIFYDAFGIGWKQIGGYQEIVRNPLKGCTIAEIEGYELPNPGNADVKKIEAWARQAERLHRETEFAVVAEHPVFGVFELGCWMFGFEDYLYRLLAEPEAVHIFSKRIWDYQKGIIDSYYGALGDYIDCTTSGDDFGTQKAPFLSAALFDEMVAPYFSERVRRTKQLTSAFYQHHTCGSVYALLPSIIECGVDILNPIQPGVHQMEPERLKSEFGGKLAFWGGVDTQYLLPFGTPDEIKKEVKRILSIMDKNGGYILSPAHTIQGDVPAENLLAVYEGAREYYE
jgi:uroporphyrinogen decarboxylase